MTGPITRHRDLESLKTAARSAGAHRHTTTILPPLLAAHAALGPPRQAAEAMRKSGLGAAPAGTQLMFGGFWVTARDGVRFTSPRILRPEPGIQVAQGYDFGALAFITTSDGVVAIDAGTTPDRAKAALGDLDLPAGETISHLILTH